MIRVRSANPTYVAADFHTGATSSMRGKLASHHFTVGLFGEFRKVYVGESLPAPGRISKVYTPLFEYQIFFCRMKNATKRIDLNVFC